jgi:energy-coupling factor transporter ATP-binding protein EcfA2
MGYKYLPFSQENSDKFSIVDFRIAKDEKDGSFVIIHHLRKEMDNGDIVTFYKATKFFKLLRVSQESKENKDIMDVHSDIIRGLYSSGIDFVEVICNILHTDTDVPMGMIMLYGVQAVDSTEAGALRLCGQNFDGLIYSFQATHRTAHIAMPTYSEIYWMFRKLRDQNYVTVVKGIPGLRQGKTGQSSKQNMLKTSSDSHEELEQFLSGMLEDEFLLLLMCSPIRQKTLRSWLTNSLEEQTKWEAQKQGSNSFSAGISVPMSFSLNNGTSSGISSSTGKTAGTSSGTSHSFSNGTSHSESAGWSKSSGTSESSGTSNGTSQNIGASSNHTNGESSGWSKGTSTNEGTSGSYGTSHSDSSGKSTTFGVNVGVQGHVGVTGGVNASRNTSSGTNDGISINSGWSGSSGTSKGTSGGTNESWSDGTSLSTGTSHGTSTSSGASTSNGTSGSTSDGYSTSESNGTSDSKSSGSSWSNGTTSGISSGWGQSMGLGPSISIGKSYQFQDITVAYICELLTTQNQRLKNMTEGEGGFYTDLYISCASEETQAALKALVTTTWINSDSKIDVIRGITPTRPEQKKLALYMQALTPCLDMETNRVGRFYKWATILQSSEITAFSHPPRITMGGIDNSMEDRPVLRVPVDRQSKEIYVGHIINGGEFNIKQAQKNHGNGYITDFKYGIGQNELHHALICGQSGSGKSVLALRMIAGLYNNTYTIDPRTGQKKRKRILVLDPNGEWRQLVSVVPAGKFSFYSLSDPHFHPLEMNILRVPRYIRPTDYYSMVTEMFCSAYGLLDRAVAQIRTIIYDLYDKAHVFENDQDPFYANEASKNITLIDVYDKLVSQKNASLANRDSHDVEALQTYLTRLDAYIKPHSKECVMFCKKGGKSVDEVLGKTDGVTVIESNGLEKGAQSFFFTLCMTTIFQYAQARGAKGFYSAEDQYETYIVLEEANSVLNPSSSGMGDGPDAASEGIKRFEDLVNQSRKFGLFVWTITQTISTMPKSVIANSGLLFAGTNVQDKDIQTIMKAIGRDGVRLDIELAKFFPRMPVGEFVCKVSKTQLEIDKEPVMVKVAPLDIEIPDNEELDVLLKQQELEARIKETDEIK